MSDPTNEQAARRLEALRTRGQAFDREYEALRRELEGYARSISGARADQADFQPESIVAHALSKAMVPAVEQCQDDGHLAGWLKQAVRHELLDRVEKRRPGRMSQEDGAGDPRDPHAGPSTEFMARERLASDREAFGRFLSQIEEASMSKEDRELIDLYVVERLAWESIAERLGTTVGAARVAMKRLRDRLLPRIFEPIRRRLAVDDWTIAEALFVRRLTAEKAAESLGVGPDVLRRIAVDRIVPQVIAEWGGESTELVLRLTGHRR